MKKTILTLPLSIQTLTKKFLQAMDTAVPGLIQALYLVGSVALDDFPPESSDVDFVAVLAERADTASLQALGEKRTFAGT